MTELKKKIIVPCIHMNGTSEKDLSDAIEAAHYAIGVAFDAIKKTAPNGRDYYVYGSSETGRAMDEYYDRLKRLQSVQEELEAIIGGIHDGEKEVTTGG